MRSSPYEMESRDADASQASTLVPAIYFLLRMRSLDDIPRSLSYCL